MILPVYTKLAPASNSSQFRESRPSRPESPTQAPQLPMSSEANNASIFSVISHDSNSTEVPNQSNYTQDATYDEHTPAPLNTPGATQRVVSTPNSGMTFPAMASPSAAPRSISMVIDNHRTHGEDSPVMNETLSVIDEHITDMNTPRSSLLASARKNPNDSGSEYSSHVDHRLSYITGNETDDEDADSLTAEEVMNWNPAQAAQYLHEIGVDQRHCDIFQEQEFSGEVLLNLEKSALFMSELELGPVGRRLATWYKIKAFQDEIKAKGHSASYKMDGDGSVVGSVTGSTSASQASTNGSAFVRGSQQFHRSPTYRHSRQNSPRIITDTQNSQEGDSPGLPKIYSTDMSNRPSAASIRDYNHSRRHSSIDFGKSEVSSIQNTTAGATPPTSPFTGHKHQSSFDKSWTMTGFPQGPANNNTRASTILGLGSLGMAGPALPFATDRNAVTPNANEISNPMDSSPREFDRGYLSSSEIDNGRKNRNVLRKNQPSISGHGRQHSSSHDARSNSLSVAKRHSRFGSAGSIMEAIASVTSSGTKNDEAKTRARTQSMKETSSNPSTATTTPNASTPLVTKLDYSESPTSLTSSKSNPVSPMMKQEGFSAFSSVTSKLRPSKRSSSEAVTGNEKAQAFTTGTIPSPIRESPHSPTRTGSTTPSAASKSLDVESITDNSIRSGPLIPASRTSSGATKRGKSKKETSAYKSLLVLAPEVAMKNCDHCGWMHKKSAKMTSTFKSRFFVLRDKRLAYYYSMNDKIEKGLIDINAHRVMMVENDIITSLYAGLAGTKSNPTSPANAPSSGAPSEDQTTEAGAGGPFFFKLVPPRTGLSKAVQFTRPAVHYFAVDSYKEGREWYLALKKASIDRDETQPVASTYSQKTISLAKAQQMKQRPPALMNLDEHIEPSSDEPQSKDDPPEEDDHGLNIQGLNLSYEYIASEATKGTSANGTAETLEANSLGPDSKRPQSDQPLTKTYKDGLDGNSTLRMVRSLSGGLGRHNAENGEGMAI
jgi:hypothetical protein